MVCRRFSVELRRRRAGIFAFFRSIFGAQAERELKSSHFAERTVFYWTVRVKVPSSMDKIQKQARLVVLASTTRSQLHLA